MKTLILALVISILTLVPPSLNLKYSSFTLSGITLAESMRTVIIKHQKVQGKNVLRVKQGDTIVLRWQTDEKVDIHLHGYDIAKTVMPDKPINMKLTATATGRFPVTSHGFGGAKDHSHGKGALFYIEVYPR